MSSVIMPASSERPEVGLSIIALMLGCLSVFLGALSAVPGIFIGHHIYARIKSNPYRFGGAKLALAGLVLCYVMCVVSVIAFVYLLSQPTLLQHIADYLGYSLILADAY